MKRFYKTFYIFLFSLLLICCDSLFAQTADEFFMLGNNAYKKGDYKIALENYTSAIKGGARGAELYYNAANACAKLGENSRAQLYYLRALMHNPRMREAHANLEILAKDSSIDLPEKTITQSTLTELSQTEWAILGVVSFWIVVLLILLPPLYGKRGAAFIFLTIVFVLVLCFSVAGVINWNIFANRAVAIGEESVLRISPTPDAPVASVVADGQIVDTSKRRGDFIYVTAPNGKRGWASLTQFEPIAE